MESLSQNAPGKGPIYLADEKHPQLEQNLEEQQSLPQKRRCGGAKRLARCLVKVSAFIFAFHFVAHAAKYALIGDDWQWDNNNSGGEFGAANYNVKDIIKNWDMTSIGDLDESANCPTWPVPDNLPDHDHKHPKHPHHGHHGHHGHEHDEELVWPESADFSVFSGLVDKFGGKHHGHHHPPPFNSTLSFTLPSTANVLSFASRATAVGSFDFGVDDTVPKDEVAVKVTAYFWHPEALQDKAGKRALVCQYKSDEKDEEGVYVWLRPWRDEPRRKHRKRFVFFHFDVRAGFVDNEITQLNHVVSNLTIFPHRFGALENRVMFESISLSAVNAPVVVKSLQAREIKAKTINHKIAGKFVGGGGSVSLATANAAIEADVVLVSLDNKPVQASLHTLHANINSTLAFVGPDAGGHYLVNATTTAGKLNIGIPIAPTNSTIHVDAATALGAVDVKLPQEYEGTYDLKTTLSNVEFEVTDDAPDPEKRGRTKTWSIDEQGVIKKEQSGWMQWVPSAGEGKARGSVRLRSLLAPIKLVW